MNFISSGGNTTFGVQKAAEIHVVEAGIWALEEWQGKCRRVRIRNSSLLSSFLRISVYIAPPQNVLKLGEMKEENKGLEILLQKPLAFCKGNEDVCQAMLLRRDDSHE